MIKQRCLEKNTVQISIPYHSIPFNVKSIPDFLLLFCYSESLVFGTYIAAI